ncbi:hypothetical protein [Actinomadura fibrosa]|uniref:Uncharacterized protein n=1 Tax=Actinomadura fibrosa TaxID=111802 RepID=A0ABW2XZL2_9ACTN|nr:hypothetical protein [Actinomadura fibrosa]
MNHLAAPLSSADDLGVVLWGGDEFDEVLGMGTVGLIRALGLALGFVREAASRPRKNCPDADGDQAVDAIGDAGEPRYLEDLPPDGRRPM